MKILLFIFLLIHSVVLAAEEPQWLMTRDMSGYLARCFVVRQDGELLALHPELVLQADSSHTAWDTLSRVEKIGFQKAAITPRGEIISVAGTGVWMSYDAGKTWKQKGEDEALAHIVMRDLYIDGNGYIYACGDNSLISDGRVLWRSRDNGESWHRIGTNAVKDVGALGVHPDGAMIIGTSDGIYRSEDKGETFRMVKTWGTLPVISTEDVEVHPGGAVFIGTNSGGAHTWRTDRTGKIFYDITDHVESVAAITVDSLGSVYMFGRGPDKLGVYRSLDTGKTWGNFNKGREGSNNVYDMVSTPEGYVYTGGSGIFRTLQRMNHKPAFWGRKQLCDAVEFVVIDSVVSFVEPVQSQSDNVTMEVLSPLGTAKVRIRLALVDTQKPGYYTLRALNALGAETIYSDTLQRIFPQPAIQQHADTLWANGGYVYKWYRNGEPLEGEREYIVPKEAGAYSVQVLNAHGCSTMSESVEYVPVSVAELTGRTTHLEQNTPNPFSEETQIGYALGQAAHVRLVVSDVTGRTISVPVDRTQEAGSHVICFSASGLAAGWYWYYLEVNGHIVDRQMMVKFSSVR